MRDGYLRGALSRSATPRQKDVLAAYVAAGSVPEAAAHVCQWPREHSAEHRKAPTGRPARQVQSLNRAAHVRWMSRRVGCSPELGAHRSPHLGLAATRKGP